MPATIRACIAAAEAVLRDAGWSSADARVDADVLVRHVLGWDRASLLVRRDEPMSAAARETYETLIGRRRSHEPVAYLTGRREFFGRDFDVSPAVLVPRPETELIVEHALRHVPPASSARVADVCTGSGILAVTLAAERPGVRVTATDLSAAALDVAARNARRHDVGSRVTWVAADLLAPIPGPFDLIVANPPYVPARDAAGLPPDVRDHEPALALFGGDDGLAIVRRLVHEAVARLAPGGLFLMEFGAGQGYDVAHCAIGAGFDAADLLTDLQGHERVLVGRLRATP